MQKSPSIINIKNIGLILGPLVFIIIISLPKFAELSIEGQSILGATLWIAIWWVTEAVAIYVTALLPIILFPLTGALSISATSSSYGHKYIFLFLGGFLLAVAIEKWNLHKRIALNIINAIGTNANNIILGFMAATAFLSMWISNTATAVMMLPIGMAVISQFTDNPDTPQKEDRIFGKALMLSIAYSASIGGIATLIGTPPNLILAGVLKETYNIDLSFTQWMSFGLPISIVLLFTCWKYLTNFAFDFRSEEFPNGRALIKQQLNQIGHISFEEKRVLAIFILTAFCWIFRSKLQIIIPHLDDTIIAMIASISLFLIPSKKSKNRLLDWEDTRKIPWGILILFGGGMALAQGFKVTGLANWIGSYLTSLQGITTLLLICILVAAVNFLTEITSNIATTAMLLPILAPLAITLDIHPYMLMISATLAASCAFMLPVATPPNAVVFGSGYLKISDMIKAGFIMNIISILIITLFVFLLLPIIWDFDLSHFPLDF
ncbi:MAG: DASS family sodium-coupled anion symporter [Saprospiraceae bacterium]